MDAERWREQQRSLRRAVRDARDGRASSSPPPVGATLPFASVIVVCFNAAGVLGRCLEALLAQDYPDYELIVVDDGSGDGTLQVAQRYESAERVGIVRSPVNRGCPHARNLGLARARGEIVAFVDADGFAAPGWLGSIVRAFEADPRIGGVASTVFYEENPMVINGAGGTVNRQGWAADLSMNESYEHAELATEALYPMGCGMAFRRKAIDRVGPFDDRMLNYYDDVDYGIRLWRAGYRVALASDAWIEHAVGGDGGDSQVKQLLCERHRMRVVLEHAPTGSLARWAGHELRGLGEAPSSRRALKLRALAWNLRHAPSTLAARRGLTRLQRPPARLLEPSWGDAFPAGVPLRLRPRPERVGCRIDMGQEGSEGQLLHGWFPAEHVEGRSYRWAGVEAAALITLAEPAGRLHLDFSHPPLDTGGLELSIRRLDGEDPLAPVWSTRLEWQYLARSIENHPLALPAGDYEAVFHAARGWSDPPRETRSLGFALSRMSFEPSFQIPLGGLLMGSPGAEDQLVSGWYEAELSGERDYRWAGGHAAALVRVQGPTGSIRLSYRLPPGPTGGVEVSVRPSGSLQPVWSTRLAWREGEWRDESLPLRLSGGDYVIAFDAERTWSNPDHGEPSLPPENRSLGMAVSGVWFQ